MALKINKGNSAQPTAKALVTTPADAAAAAIAAATNPATPAPVEAEQVATAILQAGKKSVAKKKPAKPHQDTKDDDTSANQDDKALGDTQDSSSEQVASDDGDARASLTDSVLSEGTLTSSALGDSTLDSSSLDDYSSANQSSVLVAEAKDAIAPEYSHLNNSALGGASFSDMLLAQADAAMPAAETAGAGAAAVTAAQAPEVLGVFAAVAGALVVTSKSHSSSAAAAPPTLAITSAVFGKLLDHDKLSVTVYKADGKTVIGTGKITDNEGTAQIQLNDASYRGAAIIKITGSANYEDETTGKPKTFDSNESGALVATTIIDGGPGNSVNVNPLTTWAALEAGVTSTGVSDVFSNQKVEEQNKKVAEVLGLKGKDITKITPTVVDKNTTITADEAKNSTDQVKLGVFIAAVSGYESFADPNSAGKYTGTAIKELDNALKADGSGGDAVKALLQQGAARLNTISSACNIYLSLSPDDKAPTLEITSSKSALKVGETAIVTFKFSENPGTSFDLSDIVTSGGALSNLSTTGSVRTATFTPTANTNAGSASITVALGNYSDAAGNPGSMGATPTISFDTKAPTLTITSDKSALKAGETSTITFTFSEAPTGFDASDIVTFGGALSNLSTTGSVRTATFTPTANTNTNAGSASITVAAGKYTDTAGNPGTDGTTPTLKADTLALTPRLSFMDNGTSSSDGLTNNATISIDDLEEGGTWQYKKDGAASYTTGSGSTLTATDGSHTYLVRQTDKAGNVSADSNTITVNLDSTAPTLESATANGTSITLNFSENMDAAAITSATSAQLNSLFSIQVADAVSSSYALRANAISSIAVSGKTVTLTLGTTLTGGQTVKLGYTDLSGDQNTAVLQDTAGNDVASISDKVIYTNPIIRSFVATDAGNSNGTTLGKSGEVVTLAVTFSEAVTFTATQSYTVHVQVGTDTSVGFDAVLPVGANQPTTSASAPATYTFTGTVPSTSGLSSNSLKIVSLINANNISSGSGQHPLTAYSVSSNDYTIDNAAPTVTGVALAGEDEPTYGSLNTGNKITVAVTFGEAVTITGAPSIGLTVGSGGTTKVVNAVYDSNDATNTGAGTVKKFTYTVVAADSDTDGVSIAANAISLNSGTITDVAGNVATAANLNHTAVADNAGYKIDNTAPTLKSGANAVEALFGKVMLHYNEALSAAGGSLALGDFTVSGHTVTGVTVSGNDVVLTVTPAFAYQGDGATISYTGSNNHNIRDDAGNSAGSLSAQTVTNNTPDRPSLTSPSLNNLGKTAGSVALDVTSNLVFTSSAAVSKGAGYIHILNDDGGTWSDGEHPVTGFRGENNKNNLTIPVSSSLVSINANGKIITINPHETLDLDFANHYHIEIDAGAFVDANGTGNAAVTVDDGFAFDTVVPMLTDTKLINNNYGKDGNASKKFNDAGSLVDSYYWVDLEGRGGSGYSDGKANTSGTFDLSDKSYALVFTDYLADPAKESAPAQGENPAQNKASGVECGAFLVNLNKFGTNDLLYMDDNGRNSSNESFDKSDWKVQGDDATGEDPVPKGTRRETVSITAGSNDNLNYPILAFDARRDVENSDVGKILLAFQDAQLTYGNNEHISTAGEWSYQKMYDAGLVLAG